LANTIDYSVDDGPELGAINEISAFLGFNPV